MSIRLTAYGLRPTRQNRRLPAQRARQEMEEAERRDLDAGQRLRNAPILVRVPEKIGRRVRNEEAMELPVELETPHGVHLAARGLHGAVGLRVAVEAVVRAVRRRLARVVVGIGIEVRRKKN